MPTITTQPKIIPSGLHKFDPRDNVETALCWELREHQSDEKPADFVYSVDFRYVCCKNIEYSLSKNQGRVIKCLWEARMNGVMELHQDTLLEGLEIQSKKIQDVFKNSTALYSLIVKGSKRAHYRLRLPE